MLTDLIYGKKFVTEGAIGYEYPDVLTGFQTGKAVTAFQWNAAAPTFLDASKSPETAGKLGFSMLPYFKDKGAKIARFHPVAARRRRLGVQQEPEGGVRLRRLVHQPGDRPRLRRQRRRLLRAGLAADGQGGAGEEPAVSRR